MSNGTDKEFRFRFSLRGLLIALLLLGVGFGVLGRLFRYNPAIFAIVVGVLSTIVPYLCAVGTIFWVSKRRRNTGLFLWGLLLIVLPFVGIGTLFVSQRYVGGSPSNLAALSTQQLIDQRLPKELDEPGIWREFSQRLQSGELTQAEAEAAVGKLITHMKATKPQGWDHPLTWQGDFLAGIDRAGLFSDELRVELSDAFYGPTPVLQALPRVREGSAGFDLEVEYGSAWDYATPAVLTLLCHADQVLLDGEPIEVEGEQTYSRKWSAVYRGAVSPGEHELSIEFTCAYVDQAKLIGLDAQSLPPARWPTPAKRWKKTVSAPLNVFASDAAMVQLTTDANLDPTLAITLKRCVVQAGQDGKKKVIVELNLGGAIAMSFDVSITLAGQVIPLGSTWVAPADNRVYSGGSSLTSPIESLDPVIEYADITLTPAPQHIEHRPEVTEIWGKPIQLFSVPVERLDLEIQPTNE